MLFLLALLSQNVTPQEIAARYALLTDYRVEVRTTVKSAAEGFETAKFRYALAAREPRQSRIWQESRTADRFELLLGTDGVDVWGYAPLRKRFVSKPIAQGREELAEIRSIQERFIGRFRLLDRMDVRVSTKRAGSLFLEPASDPQDWTEELWIDPGTKLIRKSVFRKKHTAPVTGWITTTTEWSNWRMAADESLFRFQPPANARQTNALEGR